MSQNVTRVFGHHNGNGPVHAAQTPRNEQLSVCGARSQFRHVHRDGTAEDVTCSRCLRLLAAGETRSWGAR